VCVKFTADLRQAPADDEVTIQVKAAGLNFRDVMLAIRYQLVWHYRGCRIR
jgi:NADPH:quinone reductase-like Zn-dependent oxidoreductase